MPVRRSKDSPGPTLADVAKRAGVSMMTVSRAVRGASNVDGKTRDRVMAIARRLGYRPNFAAKATVTGRFNAVAMLLSSKDGISTLPPHMLRGIQDELILRGYNLILSMLPDENLIAHWGEPNALAHRMCDGLLINYTHQIPQALVDSINTHHIPSIWINTDQEANAVRPDDEQAGRMAAEYLLARGHRRIGWVDLASDWMPPEQRHYSHRLRFDAYQSVMRKAGLSTMLAKRDTSLGVEERVGAVLRLLRLPEPPTAFITYGSEIFIGMAAALEGKQVGRDVSVINFSNAAANFFGGNTTSVLTPDRAMGQTAMQMLEHRIRNDAIDLPTRLLPFELSEGTTVASVS